MTTSAERMRRKRERERAPGEAPQAPQAAAVVSALVDALDLTSDPRLVTVLRAAIVALAGGPSLAASRLNVTRHVTRHSDASVARDQDPKIQERPEQSYIYSSSGSAPDPPATTPPSPANVTPSRDGGVTAQAVGTAYALAYEKATGLSWMSQTLYPKELAAIAGFVNRQAATSGGSAGAALATILRNWFAAEWPKGERYPFGALAKHTAKYYAPAPKRSSAEELADARRQLRAEYDRRHQAAKSEAEQAEALRWWSEQMAKVAA